MGANSKKYMFMQGKNLSGNEYMKIIDLNCGLKNEYVNDDRSYELRNRNCSTGHTWRFSAIVAIGV